MYGIEDDDNNKILGVAIIMGLIVLNESGLPLVLTAE